MRRNLTYLIPNIAYIAFFRNLAEFRTTFTVLTLIGTLSAALRFYTVVILGNLVSLLPTLNPTEVLTAYLPLWAASLLTAECLEYFTRRFGETLPQKVANLAQQRITEATLTAPLARLRALSRERLLTSLSIYVGHIERVGNEWSWSLIRRAFSTVAVIGILLVQSPYILVINFVSISLFLTLALSISSKIAPYAAEHRKETLKSGERQTSFVIGLPFLRRFHGEFYYHSSMSDAYRRSWGALDSLKRFHAWRWLVQLSIFDTMLLCTIGYGAYQVTQKELPLGFLVLLKWSFDELFQTLVYIIEAYVRIIHEREDARLLREQLIALGLDDRKVISRDDSPVHHFSWKCCELSEVIIRYDPADTGKPRPSISCEGRQISIPHFTLRKGEIVGLLGESGSGKTSFAEVLGRYSLYGGRYSIDGVVYPPGDSSPLRSVMITPNDPFFKTTVRDNLTLGEDIPDTRITALLGDICADFAIPHLDETIGDGRISFSTGEEQRLRLARALLHDADIVILDEPLTGIDDETRGRILSKLPHYLAGRTVLLITHRDDELTIADRVIRIEGSVLR